MMQGSHDSGMRNSLCSSFSRRLRPGRGFLMAAGLEQGRLQFLEALRLSAARTVLAGLHRALQRCFRAQPRTLRFTGDVHAMPEGTVFFPNEPILARDRADRGRRTGRDAADQPAGITRRLIASKAARMVLMARPNLLVDFGLRRAHGAALLAGARQLSRRVQRQRDGAGRHAVRHPAVRHDGAFLRAGARQQAGLRAFALAQRQMWVLLIRHLRHRGCGAQVVAFAPKLKRAGIRIKGLRIDFGHLVSHARCKVREILDDAGSGSDRFSPAATSTNTNCCRCWRRRAGGRLRAIGTTMDTSIDVPYLTWRYKLQELRGGRGASVPRASRPGRGANRCTAVAGGRSPPRGGCRDPRSGDVQLGAALLEP